MEYLVEEVKVDCSEACLLEGRCVCSKCRFRHFQTRVMIVFASHFILAAAPTALLPASIVP